MCSFVFIVRFANISVEKKYILARKIRNFSSINKKLQLCYLFFKYFSSNEKFLFFSTSMYSIMNSQILLKFFELNRETKNSKSVLISLDLEMLLERIVSCYLTFLTKFCRSINHCFKSSTKKQIYQYTKNRFVFILANMFIHYLSCVNIFCFFKTNIRIINEFNNLIYNFEILMHV